MATPTPRRLLGAFFQEMPPQATAVALRGHAIVTALTAAPDLLHARVRVFTTTANAAPIGGADVRALSAAPVDNAAGLVSRLLGEFRMGWSLVRALFTPGDRCDLALISTPAYVTALVATTMARRRGLPYVLDLRDIYPQVYAEAGLLRRDSWVYRFLARRSRRMYERAVLVVTATRGLMREVLEQAPSARVDVAYNGFPAALALRTANKHARFTICFHGVLGFFQDVESLIEVAKRLIAADVDLVVIGYGRKQSLLEEASLGNLRFLGRLPFEQTIAEIEKCHLGLCLRLDDGISKDAFPVKVWEYLGLGIPSIVTPVCEAGEFLVGLHCGLQFASGDIDRLVDAVLQLRDDRDLYGRMSNNCRQQSKPYTRENTGRLAAELIANALVRS